MSGSKFGDFLTGLIVGAALGYTFGTLSAPRAGEETRHMITEKGVELRDRARETVQGTVDKTNKLVEEGRTRVTSTVGGTVNRTRERVDEVKGRGQSLVEDARFQVSQTIRRAADKVDPKTPGTQGGSQNA